MKRVRERGGGGGRGGEEWHKSTREKMLEKRENVREEKHEERERVGLNVELEFPCLSS